MSRMTTLARCFRMLVRNSSIDRTACTERNELSNELVRDWATTGSTWRTTTLDFIFPSECSPSAVSQAASAQNSDNGADVNLRRRRHRALLFAARSLFSQGLEGFGLELTVL